MQGFSYCLRIIEKSAGVCWKKLRQALFKNKIADKENLIELLVQSFNQIGR